MLFSPAVPSIDVREYVRLRDDGTDHLLLDVRSPFERELAHLGGEHIPISELPARLDELETHRESQIVVYCRTGHRSASAVAWLRSRGFEGATNMIGGMHAWNREIDSDVPAY